MNDLYNYTQIFFSNQKSMKIWSLKTRFYLGRVIQNLPLNPKRIKVWERLHCIGCWCGVGCIFIPYTSLGHLKGPTWKISGTSIITFKHLNLKIPSFAERDSDVFPHIGLLKSLVKLLLIPPGSQVFHDSSPFLISHRNPLISQLLQNNLIKVRVIISPLTLFAWVLK